MAAVGFTSGDPRKLNRSGYAKGDVVAADASGDLTPIPVGADTEVLTADSSDSEGVDWQAGGGGGGGVPASRTIATTAPLAGGGDLSANRTLSIAVGTTAGTVAAGNDSRITGAIQGALVDAKGDLVAASAADTPARLPVGSNGQFLRANSGTGTGLEWDTVTAAEVGADPAGSAAAAQAASLQKSANLSDLANAGTARTNLGLGDSATRNVGTTAGTVAAGDDARLSDARTPLAHAASHEDGGTDEVTLAISQTTGLQAALDGKQPLDADLTAIAGLAPSNDDVIQRKAGAWTNRTLPQLKTDLAITASDVGAVPTSRTISTTSPLTGGGDLTANRTLGVSVGTGAGTVAAGDDSRITGAQQRSALTAKGDLYAATASATTTRQPVGTDGQVLRADSAQSTGLAWDTLDAADVGADASGAAAAAEAAANAYTDSEIAAIDFPVDSVNGETGTVVLDATDVGAAPTVHAHAATDITSATLGVARGGTGIASFTTNNFIRASGATSLEQRTPAQVVADIGAVAHTLADAKGDLIAASAADTFTRLPVGTNGHVLTADSAETTGMKWAAAGGGGGAPAFTQLRVNSGDAVGSNTSGSWVIVNNGTSDFKVTLPGADGDLIEVAARFLMESGGGMVLDYAAMDGSTVIQFSSSGTSTPSFEGEPSLIDVFKPNPSPVLFAVTSAMVVGGNVTVALVRRGTGGAGRVLADSNYPFIMWMKNYGQ